MEKPSIKQAEDTYPQRGPIRASELVTVAAYPGDQPGTPGPGTFVNVYGKPGHEIIVNADTREVINWPVNKS